MKFYTTGVRWRHACYICLTLSKLNIKNHFRSFEGELFSRDFSIFMKLVFDIIANLKFMSIEGSFFHCHNPFYIFIKLEFDIITSINFSIIMKLVFDIIANLNIICVYFAIDVIADINVNCNAKKEVKRVR